MSSANVENAVPELSAEDKQYLTDQASKVRELNHVTAKTIAKIGAILIKVKAKVHHGHYLAWLKAEFDWTDQTARNYVNLAELAAKDKTVLDLSIDLAALYKIAAPLTPADARESLLARATGGERITRDQAEDAIRVAKGEPKRDHNKPKTEATKQPKATEPAKPDTKAALIAAILAYEAEHGRMDGLYVRRMGTGIDLAIVASTAPTTETANGPGWVAMPTLAVPAPATA